MYKFFAYRYIVERICGRVDALVEGPVNPEGKVVVGIVGEALPLQDELDNPGPRVNVIKLSTHRPDKLECLCLASLVTLTGKVLHLDKLRTYLETVTEQVDGTIRV